MTAPRYEWACHLCEKSNIAGRTTCEYCGFPAEASPADVARAKGEPHPAAGYAAALGFGGTKNVKPAKKEDFVESGGALIMFGLYLVIASYVTIAQGKWPIFMPAQFDLIELLLKIFGEPAALYIAGGLVGILGVACCWGGIAAIVKGRHA
jgi:hypothetical protein